MRIENDNNVTTTSSMRGTYEFLTKFLTEFLRDLLTTFFGFDLMLKSLLKSNRVDRPEPNLFYFGKNLSKNVVVDSLNVCSRSGTFYITLNVRSY